MFREPYSEAQKAVSTAKKMLKQEDVREWATWAMQHSDAAERLFEPYSSVSSEMVNVTASYPEWRDVQYMARTATQVTGVAIGMCYITSMFACDVARGDRTAENQVIAMLGVHRGHSKLFLRVPWDTASFVSRVTYVGNEDKGYTAQFDRVVDSLENMEAKDYFDESSRFSIPETVEPSDQRTGGIVGYQYPGGVRARDVIKLAKEYEYRKNQREVTRTDAALRYCADVAKSTHGRAFGKNGERRGWGHNRSPDTTWNAWR